MNAMTTTEDTAELRVLQDDELDAASGGRVMVCQSTTTTIFSDKGILTFGTSVCDGGVVIPVAIWSPRS